jgi:hypothetical protein
MADIVVGVGRSAIEAMSCGRAVWVYRGSAGDGWVTPETCAAIEADGFRGRATATLPDAGRSPARWPTTRRPWGRPTAAWPSTTIGATSTPSAELEAALADLARERATLKEIVLTRRWRAAVLAARPLEAARRVARRRP